MNNFNSLTFVEQVHTIIKDNKNIEIAVDDLIRKLNHQTHLSISDFQIMIDAIDKDSILNDLNKDLCRHIIYSWRDRLCSNELITPKDIYKSLWKCRDFELSHLWQRSIFLTTFLVICYTGYGYVITKICDNIPDGNVVSLLVLNIISLVISIMGIILSLFWIMMGKGSKAWYEKYEKALYNIERDRRYCHTVVVQNMDNEALMHGSLPYVDIKKSFFSTASGPFSVSRINIAIGQVSLILWHIIFGLHSILLAVFLEIGCCIKIILIIILIVLSVIPYFLITKCNWCASHGI